MKNFLKGLIVVVVLVALAGLLYAIPTLVHEGGNAALNLIQTSASRPAAIPAFDPNQPVVVATGISSQSIPSGSAATPFTDPVIAASYARSAGGNPVTIRLANHGQANDNFVGELTEQEISGGFAAGLAMDDGRGSLLPKNGNHFPNVRPTSRRVSGPPGGSGLTGEPPPLGSPDTPGGGISPVSIDGRIGTPNETTVPDGGMTLILLGSAMSGLALLKKKL